MTHDTHRATRRVDHIRAVLDTAPLHRGRLLRGLIVLPQRKSTTAATAA